jgi:acyl carrier protein
VTEVEILQRIREVVLEVMKGRGLRAEQIELGSSVRELGLDSLHMMEFAGTLEDRLSCRLSDNALERVVHVRDLVSLIQLTRESQRA